MHLSARVIAALALNCCLWGIQAFSSAQLPAEMKVMGNWGEDKVKNTVDSLSGQSPAGEHHRKLEEALAGKPGGVFAYPYEDYTLESNGLRVIIVPLGKDFPGLVSVQIPVIVGSRNELEPGKTGMAHFFEHMMFKGTNNVSFEELSSTYSQIGARFNAFTSKDFTNYFITAPAKSASGMNNLETIMYIESDRFKHINYTEDEFKTEAGAILGEYNFRDGIHRRLDTSQNNISFATHPYQHSTIGTIEDIRDMPNEFEYSRLFFDRYYRPENTAVMVVGDVDVNETKALVEQYWSDWERGNLYVPEIPQEPPRSGAVYDHVEWKGPTQPYITVGFNAANFSDTEPDSVALSIIETMVFSYTSDLYKNLVLDEKIVLDLDTSYFGYKDPALFSVTAQVDNSLGPSLVWYVREEILNAFAKLRVELVDDSTLDRVVSAYKNAEALSYTSTADIAQTLAIYVGITGDPNSINNNYALYDTLTPEIIREVANKYFTDDRLSAVTLTFANDTLPEPNTSTALEGNTFAGSVDAIVEAVEAIEPYRIEQVILQSESSQLVYLDIRFNVGSSHDPKGKEGLAYLTAQMLDHAGSTSLTFEQVNDVLFPLAASWRASCGVEQTRFTGEVHADSLKDYYDVVSGLLLSPGFREEDFERIKSDLVQDLQDSALDARSVGKRAAVSKMYEGHPFEHALRGSNTSLASITLDDVTEFYANYYTKQNAILGVSGGVSTEFIDRITSDLQRLSDGIVDKEPLTPPEPRASNAVVVDLQGAQGTTVFLGFTLSARPTIPKTHPDYAALQIALDYYGGGGFAGLIQKEIRERRGLNYYNFAYTDFDGRNFYAELGALDTTEDAHFATRLAIHELNQLITEGMDEESFERIRTGIVNALPLNVDTQAKTLSRSMELFELGEKDDYLTFLSNAYTSVTMDQANEVARKWLQDTAVTFVFTTPEPEDVYARLTDGRPSTITYAADDKPEDVLIKDAIIMEYPLGLNEGNVAMSTPAEVFGFVEEDMAELVETKVSAEKTTQSNHAKTTTGEMGKVNYQDRKDSDDRVGRPTYLRRR